MSQRAEGAIAIVSAYVPIVIITLLDLDAGDGAIVLRIVSPVAMLLAVRWFFSRRDPERPAVRATRRTILPLLVAGGVLLLAIVGLDAASGSLEVVAAVIGALAAVVWWATPVVMAARWLREPW